MNDKSFKAYNYLLEQLESGRWDDGSKVPGARKLAIEAECGFPLMQTVVEILSQQGVLTTRPRSGTYVSENWRQRILACNLSVGRHELGEIISREKLLPEELRFSSEFCSGMFEIRVSHYLLSHHEEYYDLAEIFAELYPDKSVFFEKAISPFYVGNKLCGIPFIFSPRIMLCNRKMFHEASCPLPENDWSWDEFITALKKLKLRFPDHPLLNLIPSIHSWSTFLFRFGGRIYDPENGDPVKIDYPQSIKALQSFAELLRNFKSVYCLPGDFNDFAIICYPRQNLYPNSENEINKVFHPVRIPLPAGGHEYQ